ncbi:hypothetical protein BDW74DRAFT_181282 [Aspergillus multicolor]|uniref:uncharacterized protein n=1 Tax=Aspergillus multicolor TaxID=41759 RepID=UPI003CCD4B4D
MKQNYPANGTGRLPEGAHAKWNAPTLINHSNIETTPTPERRALKYYFERDAPNMTWNLGCQFWTHAAPSACQSGACCLRRSQNISEIYGDLNQLLGPPIVVEVEVTASTRSLKQRVRDPRARCERVYFQIARNPDLALITCVLYICAQMLLRCSNKDAETPRADRSASSLSYHTRNED